MIERTGGCLCGRLRYVASGEPVSVGLCHCKDCQKQTASAFAPIAIFPGDAVKLRGEAHTYTTTGESGGKVHRFFCPICGSGIMSMAEGLPGTIILKGGSFDETNWFRPAFNIFVHSKQDWLDIHRTGKEFQRGFPR